MSIFCNCRLQRLHILLVILVCLLLKYSISLLTLSVVSIFITLELCYISKIWGTVVGKVMSLLFNILFRLVITFLPRDKHLLISWLQSPSAVILEPQKIKSDTVSTVSPSISHQVMGPDAMIFVFWMLSFKPTFSLSSFTFTKRFFSCLHFLPWGWCHLHIWG